jgi:trigger factor
MEMKISSEKIENAQVKLNIEVEPGEVDKYMDKAYHELVQKVAVPGFRKGKTPRSVLEKHIGKESLLQEAIEHLIPDAYRKALEDENIEPIAQPDIELVQTNPVIFNAVVPLKPEINLGNYKEIKIDYELPAVEDKIKDATLQQLQYQHSTLIPVDRPADFGDMVIMDVEGDEHGNPLPLRKDLEYELIKDYQLPLPGFVEQIVGCSKGEEKAFTLSYPEDYEHKDLAGKEYKVKIKVNEIKHRELPELDEDFAKTMGMDSVDTLKAKISDDLQARAEQQYNLEYEQKVIDKVAEISEVQYPPVIVQMEIDNILNEESRSFQDGLIGLNNYLSQMNKTMEDHKKELYPIADKKVLRSLVLSKVTEVENIDIPDTEIDEEIERISKQNEQQYDEMKNFFSTPDAKNSIKQFLARQKTMNNLRELAKGETTENKEENVNDVPTE